MIRNNEFEMYVKDAEKPFSGWDFSFITETGRVGSSLLSWSYGSKVIPLIQKASSMLDMGTGGGELLAKFQPFPEKTYATEAYIPNVPIAKNRLEPLGVNVVQIGEDDLLPFEDDRFDLIINKHESYSPSEVRRVLMADGLFVTQQVGGRDCIDINHALGAPINEEFSHWELSYAEKELRENGFDVLEAIEEFPVQRFYDVGALLYYLNAIPWQITDFQSEDYMEKFYDIHKRIQSQGYFDVKQHRFIIIARHKS
ncbi:class I SAM-dependent methyltransferase [Fictibacillus nanhaiensis]|uniref:class I SAM-dependent methyltransferase n=1 Tax=Fictibacillus nanhaiensis TaxID=742169 RepID=UPI001C97997A|nr:class I SAM-dependent methyltransferase [Fictibacillus nanhaiensis]MBY6037623.1 class I SAM-dependent methyltransferase [Fictibacillus nanhaiensis]